MNETTKARTRREAEGFYTKYIHGEGIDIGPGTDPLTPTCATWDQLDGDAQEMVGAPRDHFDWVYSSHCLEHLKEPLAALKTWWSLVKRGGYLIVAVPDEDLYEQGFWPPVFNSDHKSTWRLGGETSWSPVSHDLAKCLSSLHDAELLLAQKATVGYDPALAGKLCAKVAITLEQAREVYRSGMGLTADSLRVLSYGYIDQTEAGIDAELTIEAVVRKRL